MEVWVYHVLQTQYVCERHLWEGVPFALSTLSSNRVHLSTSLQNSSDLENLSGLSEDLEQQKQIVAQSFTFRAHRAFYLAESYSEGGKLAEGMVLYDRAIEHITQASKLTVESSHAAKEVRICVCCS